MQKGPFSLKKQEVRTASEMDIYTGGEGRKRGTYVQTISLYWGMVYNTL